MIVECPLSGGDGAPKAGLPLLFPISVFQISRWTSWHCNPIIWLEWPKRLFLETKRTMQQKNAESIEEAEGKVITKLISVAATALLVVVTSASARSLPNQQALRYPAAPSYYLAPGASVYHG